MPFEWKGDRNRGLWGSYRTPGGAAVGGAAGVVGGALPEEVWNNSPAAVPTSLRVRKSVQNGTGPWYKECRENLMTKEYERYFEYLDALAGRTQVLRSHHQDRPDVLRRPRPVLAGREVSFEAEAGFRGLHRLGEVAEVEAPARGPRDDRAPRRERTAIPSLPAIWVRIAHKSLNSASSSSRP